MVLNQFFKTIVLSVLLMASTSFATPDLLPFQGRLTDSGGSPINIATVVKFRIYPPAGSCYLYEDTQTITPNTFGVFTALLGAAGNKTFSGPMVNFRDVFNNSSTGVVNNCSTLYIPGQNDWRRIEVEAGGVTSADMQTIGSAPFSFESKNSLNLGGLPSTSFLRVNGALTQFAAEALVNGADASAYHNHDSLYARLDGSTPYTGNISTVANIYTTAGTVGIGTATAAADLEVNKTNPDIRLTATAAGGGTSKIDFFSGAAAQRASIQSSEATNEMRFFTGTTEAMRLDANQNAFFNSSIDVAGTLSLGQYSSAQETTILLPSLTTSGAAANGTAWVNTGGVIKFWDGGNIRTIANLNAVVNSITAGTGITMGGTATVPTVSVNYGTTAGTAIQGNATFGGDVSGNFSNLTVDRIDGSAVDLSVAPAATQVLKFNGTAWVAAADVAGLTAETDPTVTAWAKNAPAGNFVTTGNVLQLSNSGVTAGTYGSGSAVPVFTVDIFGRISAVTNTSIGINASQVTAGTLPVTRGGTGAAALTGEGVLVMNTTGTAATSMTCAINQILKWTGTAWACAADENSNPGDASYAAKGIVQFDTNAATSGITVASGIAKLANSGATAGSYGSATQVPAITVDAFGRITSVANTAIALSATDITSGTLPMARGGTGQNTYTDGQLLIGNSVGNTLTKATLTAGSGISITNGNGSISIAATGGSGTVTSVSSANTDIGVSMATPTPVLTLNSGTGNNQIVKLNASAELPAVSGVNLTGLNATNLGSGTVPAARMPALTGDVTTSAGAVATTIAANSVTSAKILDDEIIDADVKSNAAIARTKLASGTINHVLINNGSGVMASEANLAVSRGGTGAGSFSANKIVGTNATGTALTSFTCTLDQVIKFDVSGNAVCGTDSGSGGFADGGNTFSATATIGTNSNHNLEIETNGTTKMTVLANGNVGVGTTGPAARLTIQDTSASAPVLIIGNSSGSNINFNNLAPSTDRAYFGYNPTSTNAAFFNVNPSGGFLIGTANTERLRVDSSGNVGIGTPTPTAKLDVGGQTRSTNSAGATQTNASAAVNWNNGNVQTMSVDCATTAFTNMLETMGN